MHVGEEYFDAADSIAGTLWEKLQRRRNSFFTEGNAVVILRGFNQLMTVCEDNERRKFSECKEKLRYKSKEKTLFHREVMNHFDRGEGLADVDQEVNLTSKNVKRAPK